MQQSNWIQFVKLTACLQLVSGITSKYSNTWLSHSYMMLKKTSAKGAHHSVVLYCLIQLLIIVGYRHCSFLLEQAISYSWIKPIPHAELRNTAMQPFVHLNLVVGSLCSSCEVDLELWKLDNNRSLLLISAILTPCQTDHLASHPVQLVSLLWNTGLV